MSELLTIAMAAEACHVHPKTIERAIRDRGLRASQLADRGCWVIQPDDLDEWVQARANRPRTTSIAQAPVQPRPRPGRHGSSDELHDLVPPARRHAA